MKRLSLVVAVIMAVILPASAGSISGRVSGVGGKSAVYVDTIPGKPFRAPTQHMVMDQKGLLFVPHILVVQQGTTVDFLNSDNVQHNVFWASISGDKKAGHNLGTWPKGEKRSWKFDHPGVVPLLCNVHPEMSGYIVVSSTPYFAETDADGAYHIKDVPDGSYTVVAWHEGAKAQSKPVTVKGDTTQDFALTK